MKKIRIIAWISTLIMLFMIVFSLLTGDFFEQGSILMGLVWGQMSLVDLYVGFALFSLWIVFREKAVVPSVIWVVLMMVLGFWAGAMYTLLALQSSKGDWKRFWYGKRA